VRAITRRGKYLLIDLGGDHLIVHLGMSGSLAFAGTGAAAGKHDHVDFDFGARLLRLRDPRRFGAVLCCDGPPPEHPLLRHLGVEPLSGQFNGPLLHRLTRASRVRVKPFLMDARRVVGVGNIYASESLFHAGIHPRRRAGSLSAAECARLATEVRRTLSSAIRAGGSTLRDFVGADGSAGRYGRRHAVYDRAGKPCRRCAAPIRRILQGQRATYYCARCQR
jgi:formamidopyrimidine-DNA glycosylase